MADEKKTGNGTTQPAPAADKMERIEKYRARVHDLLGEDFPADGGFASAKVYHQGIEITVGQRARTMYDALAALTVGLGLAQYELQVSVKTPDAPPASKPEKAPASPQSTQGGASTTSTPVAGPVKAPAGPAVAAGGPAVVSPGVAQLAPAGNGGGQAGTIEFPVEVIIFGQGGAHPYWIVRGGIYKKRGVMVWPEVLEKWGVQGLDPMSENQIETGWVAVCSKNKNGNPDKVIEFVPAGQ